MRFAVGFAGFGGMCLGITQATGRSPVVAVNHWPLAIRMHAMNHPETRHFCEDVREFDLDAAAGGGIGWIHVSPDCTHFSKAKGKQPRRQDIRGLAWVLVGWAERSQASILSLENVEEFLDWGPLDENGQPIEKRKGEHFREFVQALRALGYAVEWRVLAAHEYGAPTIRRRLFLMARRDGDPIRWPRPTHGDGLLPFRTAAECIDWTVPAASIFGRKRTLAESTQRRIAEGLMRFARPVQGSTTVLAWIAKHYSGVTGTILDQPLGTVTAKDHHSLCVATLGDDDHPGAGRVGAFITSYYSGGGTAHPIGKPLPTVTATARHGLVQVRYQGRCIVDLGMRMLTPRELARAQGFPDSYQLAGTISEQIRAIGNSVCPQVARALVEANLPARQAVA